MPDRLLYLAIDAGVLLVPFLFSWHPRIRFYLHWKAFLAASLVTLIPFIIWDIAFTNAGVWGFQTQYLVGLNLLGLPLEEWLFFICIPYACIFTFYCFGLVQVKKASRKWYPFFAIVSALLILVSLIYRDRDYTFLALLLCGLALGYLSLVEKPAWLPRAVLTYLCIFPFFYFSNGLLTGSWIHEQVVWYNNSENLGIRLGTIPIEDNAYGFLLVLLNITLFEHWRKK